MAQSYRSHSLTFFMLFWMATLAWALPGSDLQRRTDPYFPDTPASCPICAKDYDSIRSCAQAAPVLQNFTNVIFNPGAFYDTIKCACTDTFKAVFPQCVDCFIATGQQDVIMGQDLPSVVEGIRQVCAFASTLLGNVTATNNATANAPPSSVGYRARIDTIPVLSLMSLALALSLLIIR